MKAFVILVPVFLLFGGPAKSETRLTLEKAIRQAVAHNPRIGEAAANRRAIDMEVRQQQGVLLPQVRTEAEYGSERLRGFDGLSSARSKEWRKLGGEGSLVVNQLLFDGGATINQIYRQMARSDAAAWRTFERAELIALDTAEAFLDIVRYSASIQHANAYVAVHERMNAQVGARQQGGRAGLGDAEQVRERLNAARAVRADLKIRLEEAKAAFRRSVGVDANRLGGASRLSGLPKSQNDAVNQTFAYNPSLKAAHYDVVAAERDFDSSAGRFAPRVSLEGRTTGGRDSGFRVGNFDESTAKLRMDWNLFAGGTDAARRGELRERVTEAQMRTDSLQRSVRESVHRAWAARANSGTRIGALQGQIVAARRVVTAYRGEYELGQRTLLDLLNAENALFNAALSLEAARTVAVFADYQLLATTGQLLARLNIPHHTAASPLADYDRGILPKRFVSPVTGELY